MSATVAFLATAKSTCPPVVHEAERKYIMNTRGKPRKAISRLAIILLSLLLAISTSIIGCQPKQPPEPEPVSKWLTIEAEKYPQGMIYEANGMQFKLQFDDSGNVITDKDGNPVSVIVGTIPTIDGSNVRTLPNQPFIATPVGFDIMAIETTSALAVNRHQQSRSHSLVSRLPGQQQLTTIEQLPRKSFV